MTILFIFATHISYAKENFSLNDIPYLKNISQNEKILCTIDNNLNLQINLNLKRYNLGKIDNRNFKPPVCNKLSVQEKKYEFVQIEFPIKDIISTQGTSSHYQNLIYWRKLPSDKFILVSEIDLSEQSKKDSTEKVLKSEIYLHKASNNIYQIISLINTNIGNLKSLDNIQYFLFKEDLKSPKESYFISPNVQIIKEKVE